MTVASTSTKAIYSANGVTTTWPITFPYYDSVTGTDIKLYLTATGGSDVLISSSDYTVDVTNGNVIYPTVASGLPAIATGNTITLVRVEDLLQGVHLTTQGPFVATNVESALDKAAMSIQQVNEALSRVPQYPISTTPSATDTTTFISTVAGYAATAAAGAATLVGTSVSSNTVGTGAKTFVTQSSKTWAAGQYIIVIDSANSANYMHGTVTSYSGTSLVINSLDTGGSGTKTSWNIYVSGTQGSTGLAGATTVRGTFTNASLSAGVLTITHNGALSSPYVLNVYIYNNSGVMVFADQVNTFATNSCKVDLTSYGVLTGTWSYSYVL